MVTREINLPKVKDIDDPRRCTATTKTGVCMYMCFDESIYCEKHARMVAKKEKEKQVDMYRLGQYQARVKDLGEHEDALGLRSELGILRMSLESLLTACQIDEDNTQLLLNIQPISDLVQKINRIVIDCHKLEQFSGEHLTKSQIIEIAQRIMNLVAAHVEPEVLSEIANQITEEIEKVQAITFAVDS